MYEVEQKYILRDAQAFFRGLASYGIQWQCRVEEADTYFQHPSRDFVQTDEAFRIRERSVEDLIQKTGLKKEYFLTYKGPRLDSRIKTRKELELPFVGSVASWEEMLACLGFRKVQTVRKKRQKAWFSWNGALVEISLDEVPPLGQYVELEVVVQETCDLESTREKILSLSEELGLREVEPRSYLDLVLSHPFLSDGRK